MKNQNVLKGSMALLALWICTCLWGHTTSAQSVQSFTLVNAATDTDIMQLQDGSNINLTELPTNRLNVRANVDGAVESVKFHLNGRTFRTENFEPYALAGDRASDYFDWKPKAGTYKIKATPYKKNGASGKKGTPLTITIVLTNEEPEVLVTDLAFVNCPSSPLNIGEKIDLDVAILPSNATNKRIAYTASDGVSVDYLSGEFTALTAGEVRVTAASLSNEEVSDECLILVEEPVEIIVTDLAFTNCPTESLTVGDVIDLDVLITPANATNQTIAFTASDGLSVDFLSGVFTANAPGEIVVTATSFSDGTISDQCNLAIEEPDAPQEVTDFVLVDAVSNDDLGPLEDGDTLNLFYLPSQLSVRANTDPEPVGSVGFAYDDNANFQTENFLPYAIKGDANGDYRPWLPTLGEHRLTATPFEEAKRSGTEGISKTVNFVVIEEDTTTVEDPDPPTPSPPAKISGELKKWHKVTLSFEGPSSSETGTDNPFTDYRLNVTFTNGDKTYDIPGFYAADGDAAFTSATRGNVWQVHFSPDKIGTWTYLASFRAGQDIAISLDPSAGTATSFDGETGSFEIEASDKRGQDLRSKGRLSYVGEHYLQFEETGDYFFKAGPDAPENTLAYEDFDDTPNKSGRRKSWSPHLRDFDIETAGSHTWGPTLADGASEKGRGLLGAVKYLADQGMNAFSFLTFSLDGDDDNVYPQLARSPGATNWEDVYHDRFDVSKLAQWERIFSYADQLGMYLHFKTQETENDQKMDNGRLGRERKLYYRELIARFGHHLALNWNLGEENDIWQELSDPNNDIVKSYADFISDLDPYDHHIVIHTYPGQQNQVYGPLLGNQSALTGASIQTGVSGVHNAVKNWVERSAEIGKKWVVANDEQGSATSGVAVDADYPINQLPETRNVADNRDDIRKSVLWGTLMAGGAGVEYYYGYQTGCDDLDCEDHRTRASKWADAGKAIEFFNNYLQQHITDMANANDLTPDKNDYILAKEGVIYVIYRPNGGTTRLNLLEQEGSFKVQWFDPRNGGDLQSGSISLVGGGANVSIGSPPANSSADWVAVVTKSLFNSSPIDEELRNVGDNQVKAYPNPAVDRLSVALTSEHPVSISLLDLRGQILETLKGVQSRAEFDLKNVPPGMYVLQIRAGMNHQEIKILKE